MPCFLLLYVARLERDLPKALPDLFQLQLLGYHVSSVRETTKTQLTILKTSSDLLQGLEMP